MDLQSKLAILADAAKYDASCASSGSTRKDSAGGRGMGSTGGMGICHSYAPDGRCISLLKILLTNFCIYDCLYCVNRISSNVQRARFTVDEVVKLTLDFYSRNYIEGLFLSSGIIRDADYTMEQLVAVARTLRVEHDFRGYIHLKTIPDASDELSAEAARYADRVSVNVELPTEAGLNKLAPEKDSQSIKRSMAHLREHIDAGKDEAKRSAKAPKIAPAGQSTQMIIGADDATDAAIIEKSVTLYSSYRLRRVYYSAFSPIADASTLLPVRPAPLIREHRLYQTDWLLRFYGFRHQELFERTDGMLDLDVDPKLAWALKHREQFPIDINRAPRERLLRVPGLGQKAVERLIAARKLRTIRVEDLRKLHVPVKRVLPFVKILGQTNSRVLDSESLQRMIQPEPQQLGLWG
ncbi:MAG TPA: putative DNA modification/repair radical SAM protein [Steroidobacteraceae bacterium]|nr:putative DNA modification/repair radical SAM protein [Steroidobacteraceae bacterium]